MFFGFFFKFIIGISIVVLFGLLMTIRYDKLYEYCNNSNNNDKLFEQLNELQKIKTKLLKSNNRLKIKNIKLKRQLKSQLNSEIKLENDNNNDLDK